MFQYIFAICVVCFITYLLQKVVFALLKCISYQEKYDYIYKSKKFLLYIVNALTMISSVVALYICKYDTKFVEIAIYLIMPIIIFSGVEELVITLTQNTNEKQKFVNDLYNELIILKDVSYKQITDYSCIKIRINISITPYMIESCKKYFQYENNKYKVIFVKHSLGKKDKFLINTLNDCKNMLLKEYKVYCDEERKIFEKELFNNIENLAKYLIDFRLFF